jgi:hypothetical protein
VLLGFALTALWMGQRRGATDDTLTQRPSAALAEALPQALPSLASTTTAPEPKPSAAPSASLTTPARLAPTAVSGQARKKASGQAASKSRAPRSAIAPGLELSTREP